MVPHGIKFITCLNKSIDVTNLASTGTQMPPNNAKLHHMAPNGIKQHHMASNCTKLHQLHQMSPISSTPMCPPPRPSSSGKDIQYSISAGGCCGRMRAGGQVLRTEGRGGRIGDKIRWQFTTCDGIQTTPSLRYVPFDEVYAC